MAKMNNYLVFPAIVDTAGQYNQMRTMGHGHHLKYHMDRMRNVKPVVDNKAPKTFTHCHMKMKKMQRPQMAKMNNDLVFPAIVDTAGQYNQMRKMGDSLHLKYHMDRMRNVKPMVDNKAPRTFTHCHMKMKKMQMEQERLMEVERDNRLLVSRIARTMAKGGLDNWNESYEVYSKNWSEDVRNRELVKISLENQAILNKINMAKPVYDHKQWLNDFKVTREYMKRLIK